MRAKGNNLKPLCAALLLGLGLGVSPIASAVLAPNIADTFYLPALGVQQPNNAQLPYLKVAPGTVALLKFDMSTLPAQTRPEDVERAVVILAVQKSVEHGGIDAHIVLTPSHWSEVGGVGHLVAGSQFSQFLCKAEGGHEHYISIDVTEAVRFWLKYPEANNGLALVSSALFPGTNMEFDSREMGSFAPVLDIQLFPGEGFVGVRGLTGEMGPIGLTGPVGPAGPAGPPGPAGEKGATGATGPAGPAGVAGAAGPAGPQGLKGDIGPAGPQGLKGDVGPAGPQGVPGATGAAGPVGPIGPLGPAGPQGLTGAAGPAGPQGLKGDTGAQGPAGPQGLTGEIGAQGPAGPIGPMGPQGLKGEAGATGPQGATGPAGPTGATGPAGADGATGAIGPIGPMGPMGAMGLQGPQGPQGPAGQGVDVTVVAMQYSDHRGNAWVHCPSGYRVTGGGAYLDETNPRNLHTSAPFDNGNAWIVGYGEKATFTVFAVCAR